MKFHLVLAVLVALSVCGCISATGNDGDIKAVEALVQEAKKLSESGQTAAALQLLKSAQEKLEKLGVDTDRAKQLGNEIGVLMLQLVGGSNDSGSVPNDLDDIFGTPPDNIKPPSLS